MMTFWSTTLPSEQQRIINTEELLNKRQESIEDTVLEAEIVHQNLQKLKGEDNFYRIRIGDYRIGIKVNDDTTTFVRLLHRREIC